MRFYALDLVRFFSAMMVVLYHYTARFDKGQVTALSELTKFGYLGVPLFFMISGFVISASAQNRSPVEFAISRVVRLYPAFWIGVIFTTITVNMTGVASIDITQFAANLTMLNDYFNIPNVSNIYWTLQAELKFYGCVFLLLAFGVFNRYKIWLGIWTVMTLTYLLFQQPFFMSWFITPYYSSLFIAGVVFYLIWQEGADWYYILILSISLAISSVNGYHQAAGYMRTAELSDQITSVALIWTFYLLFTMLVMGKLNIKKSNVVLTLGGMTYPLYLIHSRGGKAMIDSYKGVVPEDILIIVMIIIMLTLSYLIHIGIEKQFANPLKNFLFRNASKISILATRKAI